MGTETDFVCTIINVCKVSHERSRKRSTCNGIFSTAFASGERENPQLSMTFPRKANIRSDSHLYLVCWYLSGDNIDIRVMTGLHL